MSQTLKYTNYPWLSYLNHIDSTNNYAMDLISDGLAEHAQVVAVKSQLKSRGQRNKLWITDDRDIKMSLLLKMDWALEDLYVFSMLIALAVHQVLEEKIGEVPDLKIKWPNDIYINDKKASGILIENVLKGSQWDWAVVGIGMNIVSKINIDEINAIGMEDLLDEEIDIFEWMKDLRAGILNHLFLYQDKNVILKKYNQLLFKKDEWLNFEVLETEDIIHRQVKEVNGNGLLVLWDEKGMEETWSHGTVKWLIG